MKSYVGYFFFLLFVSETQGVAKSGFGNILRYLTICNFIVCIDNIIGPCSRVFDFFLNIFFIDIKGKIHQHKAMLDFISD